MIQNTYAHVALLSSPNSSDFIFPGTAPNYIYNPLLTVKECNATLLHSLITYALLKLAKKALYINSSTKKTGPPSLPFSTHHLKPSSQTRKSLSRNSHPLRSSP